MTKFELWKQSVKGKHITVIGVGVSNRPLIRFLCSAGAVVTACDRRDKDALGDVYDEFSALGVVFRLGENYLENLTGEIIFKTPGLRYDVPQLQKARENGAVVTSEMEVFFDLCPAHIIGVTGSDGKTTTTTLIHKFMTDSGYKTWLGGNIGNPLLTDTDKMTENDWVILELSSFQLQTLNASPEIAVITNLSPNHLDFHTDYREYIDSKKNIFLHQSPNQKLVLNMDNPDDYAVAADACGKVEFFSRTKDTDCCLKSGTIFYKGEPVLDISDIKIPGMHNVENYMTAIAATGGLVDKAVIQKTAREFGGVEHRIELVRELDGVKYYNSSIDSSPNRTMNTLSVFPEKVIMIGGGKDKGIPYDDLGPVLVEHVKTLILIGATSDKIEDAVRNADGGEGVEIIRCTAYDEAVNTAYSKACAGDIVVLSPASTSFDMFANFMERGDLFKRLVNSL